LLIMLTPLAILNHILNGAILRAVEALQLYFPSVLDESQPHSQPDSPSSLHSNGHSNGLTPSLVPRPSSFSLSHSQSQSYTQRLSNHSIPVYSHSTHPAHLALNLRIQQFIESFRNLSPSSPNTTPSSSISSLPSPSNSMHLSMSISTTLPPPSLHPPQPSSSVTLTHALTAAQGLHAEAKKLPLDVRGVYLQEIKDVGALFAYTDVENSILKGFLDQSRRISLSEQVNRAILSEW
jgi:hypothetical protein